MAQAVARCIGGLTWREDGGADPAARQVLSQRSRKRVGDVGAGGRKETPTSYHLSVTLDDARQGVSDVVRGQDLFHATSVHRLLQALLGLPAPAYRHHKLILGEDGRKLSKSTQATALRVLRATGATAHDIRLRVGLPQTAP